MNHLGFIGKIKEAYIPLSFFLLNIILKTIYLTSEPVSHDEPFTIYFAQFDVANLVKYLANYNNPPLYEIILHFWIKIAGINPISVRFLPMLFGSLSVVFIFKIGQDFFSRNIGIVAALLYSFSTITTWYAHDCRAYSLFLLLTGASFYVFFKLLNTKSSFKWFLIYTLLISLLVYTHYFGVLVVCLQGLIFVIHFIRNRRPQFLYHMISVLLCLILYIPQLHVIYSRANDSISKGTWLKEPMGIESIYNLLWAFSNKPLSTVICIAVLVIAAVKYLFLVSTKNRNWFAIYAIIWFLLPLFLLFGISYKVPVFLDRYLLFILPPYYILVTIAAYYIIEQKPYTFILPGVMVLLFVLTFQADPSKKREIPELVNYVEQHKSDKTAVVVCPADFMLAYAYHYNKDLFKIQDQSSEYTELEGAMREQHIYFTNHLGAKQLNELSGFDTVLYVDAASEFSFPGNHVKEDIGQIFKQTKTVDFPEIFKVYEFGK